ncbi:MAG: DUF7873 family protein [Candidatus Thorarchaeota archaeon]|jgi:hypothetical protein
MAENTKKQKKKSLLLHQLLAVEKNVSARSKGTATRIYQTLQKGALFSGQRRKWIPLEDNGPLFPDDSVKVQQQVPDLMGQFSETVGLQLSTWFQRDMANQEAKASVEVDGHVIIEDAPVSFLLSLEKKLDEIRPFIQALPTLATADNWAEDNKSGLYKSDRIMTQKTQKIQQVNVIFQPSEHAPGGVYDKTPEDKLIGHWETIKESGAITETRKRELIARFEKVIRAVKQAREEANQTEIPAKNNVGEDIFGFLFG